MSDQYFWIAAKIDIFFFQYLWLSMEHYELIGINVQSHSEPWSCFDLGWGRRIRDESQFSIAMNPHVKEAKIHNYMLFV